MNISDKNVKHQCTSCQMCSAVCNSSAICIKLDANGFYRPYIDSEKCNSCGLCVKVCYKFDSNIKLTSLNSLKQNELYAAAANDDDVVKSTSSGGIADILARKLFEDGYNVIGVVYDNEHNDARHIIAKQRDDLDMFRGSKYIQPFSSEAFRTLVEGIKDEKFAVFGLPCQIYAISRYLEIIKKRENCALIDLYCHGCPSISVWKKISDDIKLKTGARSFDKVIWRSKLRGWGTYVLEVKNNGKRIYNSTPRDNGFFDLFFCNQILNNSCFDCKVRSSLEYTDIRLGDFWGPDFRKTYRGMSGVSIATEKGGKLFDSIKQLVTYREMTVDSFFPYQSWNRDYMIDETLRRRLMSAIKDENTMVKDAVKLLPSHNSPAYKVKVLIKQLFYYLPIGFSSFIRK